MTAEQAPAWAVPMIEGIAALRGEVAELRGEVAELRGEVGALGARLDAKITALAASVDAELAVLRSDMASLRTDLASLRDRFDREFPRLRADLMARLDRVQDQIAAHHRDINVNFASSDRALKLVRGQREEIAGIEEQLSALTRLVHHLQGEIHALRGDG